MRDQKRTPDEAKALVEEAYLTFGPKAAQELWEHLGLPKGQALPLPTWRKY